MVRKDTAHRSTALVLLAAVIVLDQVVKAWAWRSTSTARINYGGNAFVGDTVSRWYADPVTGAVLDLLDFGLLAAAVVVLLHGRRPTAVLVTGSLMVGGWISNLVDRLGLHHLTAPGSVRGAVDFIPLGGIYYNVADVFIVCGTLLLILSVCATSWSAGTGSPAPRTRLRARGWMSTIATGVGLAVVVAIGAVNYGGVTAPDAEAGTVGER
jgi:lipoprotein signal peptidase